MATKDLLQNNSTAHKAPFLPKIDQTAPHRNYCYASSQLANFEQKILLSGSMAYSARGLKNKLIDRINNRANTLESGFTIVELLITLVVGAVLVTGINSIVISQSFLAERSRDLIIANAFVETRVESLRSLGFSGLSDGTTDITGQLPIELSAPRSASQVISSQSPAIKKAVHIITYNEQGVSRTYSYSTFIGELGVGQY